VHYLPLCNNALILDNSVVELTNIIAKKHNVDGLKIENPNIWKEIEEGTHAKRT
jgi:predicted ABC-type ATPase